MVKGHKTYNYIGRILTGRTVTERTNKRFDIKNCGINRQHAFILWLLVLSDRPLRDVNLSRGRPFKAIWPLIDTLKDNGMIEPVNNLPRPSYRITAKGTEYINYLELTAKRIRPKALVKPYLDRK